MHFALNSLALMWILHSLYYRLSIMTSSNWPIDLFGRRYFF